MFDNRDRYFDPAINSFIDTDVQIRVLVEHGGTVYHLFRGRIDSYKYSFPGMFDHEVQVEAIDMMTNLNNAKNLTYRDVVLADNPLGYWPMDDEGQTLRDLSGNGNSVTFNGPVAIESEDTATHPDSVRTPRLEAANQEFGDGGYKPELRLDGDFTIEFWCKEQDAWGLSSQMYILGCSGDNLITAGSPTLLPYGNISYACSVASPAAGTDSYHRLQWVAGMTSGSTSYAEHYMAYTDRDVFTSTDWRHVVWTRDSATGEVSLYINNEKRVLVDTGTTSAYVSPDKTDQNEGRFGLGNLWYGEDWSIYEFDGYLHHVALYDRVLTRGAIEQHYEVGLTRDAMIDTDSQSRLGEIRNDLGLGAFWSNFDAGHSTLERAWVPTYQLLEHARDIETTEGGVMFIDGEGKWTFQARDTRWSVPSVATFGDGAGEVPYVGDLEIGFDNDILINRAIAQPVDGTPYDYKDDTSVAARGEKTRRVPNLLVRDSDEVESRAQWWVNRYKDPQRRVERVTLRPEGDPATIYPQALGRTISDKITLRRDPTGTDPIVLDVFVEGVRHSFDRDGDWETTFQLSPATMDDVFTIEDDTYGTLDGNNRLAFGSATASL